MLLPLLLPSLLPLDEPNPFLAEEEEVEPKPFLPEEEPKPFFSGVEAFGDDGGVGGEVDEDEEE